MPDSQTQTLPVQSIEENKIEKSSVDYQSKPVISGQRFFIIIIVILLLISVFVGGYFVGNNKELTINKLFTSQTALIKGKILEVNGDKIKIENEKGEIGEVPLNSKLSVIKMENGKPKQSSNSSSIELNKDATIELNLFESTFKVTGISFIPPVKLPPKTSTSSAQPRFILY